MFSLNVWLCIAQGLLAAMFSFEFFIKSFRPIAALKEDLEILLPYRPATTRFIGIPEGAGAVGMILPMPTGILVWLTPLAAMGFIVIQALAIRVHAKHNVLAKMLPFNLALLGLSLFLIWGRWDLFGF